MYAKWHHDLCFWVEMTLDLAMLRVGVEAGLLLDLEVLKLGGLCLDGLGGALRSLGYGMVSIVVYDRRREDGNVLLLRLRELDFLAP